MSAIFEKPVRVSQIVTTSLEEARALDDPIRIAMLEMLSEKPMSIVDLATELKKRDVDKAPTTIRHHLALLKKASLIELTRAEDIKGGVLKYYAAKAKFLGHYAPRDLDTRFQLTIAKSRDAINTLVEQILEKEGGKIKQVAEEIKPCPYCKVQDFEEYVMLTLLNKAVVEAIRSDEFKETLKRLGKG
ncbi:MAG: ArsR/SmtB family transcription factor [Nitrososphaerales archaeon]